MMAMVARARSNLVALDKAGLTLAWRATRPREMMLIVRGQSTSAHSAQHCKSKV